jgi:acetolactate synthase regulatory subunit
MESTAQSAPALIQRQSVAAVPQCYQYTITRVGGLERLLGVLRRKGIQIEKMTFERRGRFHHLSFHACSQPSRDVEKLLSKLWDCERSQRSLT